MKVGLYASVVVGPVTEAVVALMKTVKPPERSRSNTSVATKGWGELGLIEGKFRRLAEVCSVREQVWVRVIGLV